MNTRVCCAAMAAVLALHAQRAPGDWRVWAVTDTRRVLRDERPAADAPAAAKLAAARNEWESFQVLVRSAEPAAGVSLTPGDLAGPGGAVLRAGDARLYRQHQLRLDAGTHRNAKFQPGWYPDALIPVRHPLTGRPLESARLRAMPFDLPADETHGFWVDLHVPPSAPAGTYRGEYRLSSQGGRSAVVPVELTVWDFSLPDTPTFRTAFGSPGGRMRSYYARLAKAGKGDVKPPADWQAVEDQCAELLSRHRLNATPPGALLQPVRQPDGTFRFSPEQVRALAEFIDRHHLNAVQVPHPSGVVKDPDKETETLAAWLAGWDRLAGELNRPQVVFYIYLKDEPNDEEAYAYVRKWGGALRRARSAVKVLVVEQTWTQKADWGDLYGAVDIWCPLFSLFQPDSAAARRKLGESLWTYTALCQGKPTPWWHIDYPLANYRVPAWIAWRYRMAGLLYWGGLTFWNQVEDPWTDPRTYRPGDGKLIFNGEGTLAYPGRAAGYDGIAPSLRLKALRDGIEDYEYLAILARLGQAEPAEQIVLPLAGSWTNWNEDPAAYCGARAQLADLIVAASTRPGKTPARTRAPATQRGAGAAK